MSDDKLKSASNRISIKRKDGNNSSIVKVESGTKAKFYLEVQNAPHNTIKYIWNIDYLRKETQTNTIAVAMSNSFCGDIEVKVECITETIGVSSKISLIEGTELASQKIATTRKFKLQCPPLIRKVSFCFNHNEVPRIPNQDGVYELNHLAIAAFSIELEGYNGQEFEAYVVSSKGTFDLGKAIVNRNYVIFKNFILKYDEQDKLDLLIFCYYNKKIGHKVESFKVQISQHKLRDEEIEANKQVVVAGYPLQIADNNYHPCKFVDVEIREIEPNKNVIVDMVDTFKEMMDDAFGFDWHVLADHPYTNSAKYTELDYDIKDFVMIGNNNAKDVLVLVKDFTTSENDCDNVPIHKKVVYVKKNSTEKKEYPIKNDEVHLSIKYPYEDALTMVPFWYFFPVSKAVSQSIIIESCRRCITIPVFIYPDIQWFVGLKFKINKGIKANGAFKDLFKKDIYKAIKNNNQNTFSIGVIANWNEHDSASVFIEPLDLKKSQLGGVKGVAKKIYDEFIKHPFCEALIDVFRTFEDIVSLIELFKLANSLAEPSDELDFAKKRKTICDLEILLLPDITLGVSWRAGAYNGKGGLIIEGVGEGNIIKVTGKVDLFCLASKMNPSVALAITALELIEWATEMDFVFQLLIEGSLKWDAKIGYDLSQDKEEGKLAIGGLLEVTIQAYVKTKPSTSYQIGTTSTKEYGVKGVCGISGDFIVELLNNDSYPLGVYSHIKSKFLALVIEVYIKMDVSKTGETKRTNPNMKTKNSHVRTIVPQTLINEFNIKETVIKRII